MLVATALATAAVAASTAATRGWLPWRNARGIVDVVGPRRDGRFVIMAAGRLRLIDRAGRFAPLPAAARAFRAGSGETYVDLAPSARVGRCAWPSGAIAVLRPSAHAVALVPPSGRPLTLARLPRLGLLDGIAFDRGGRFGGRLLVSGTRGARNVVVAIACDGRVTTIAHAAPAAEGGMVTAPAAFGRFGGQLLMAGERSGKIWAVAPSGRARLVAKSGLPRGPDIGVESLGIVPAGARFALVADLSAPGNPHPGSDHILRLALGGTDVRAGDLLAVAEGGARTIRVRCQRSCTVAVVVRRETRAHVEGHVAFAR
jgi:hypothetical protein